MKKTAFISDIIFAFFTCTIFTLCLFRYLGLSLALSLLLSILCGALCALSVAAWLYSKRKYRLLKKSDEQQKQKLILHLILLSDDKKLHFFQQVFADQSPKRSQKLRLSANSSVYFLQFSFLPVNADAVAPIVKLKTNKQKILLCDQIDEAANKLCKTFGIEVKTGNEVYLLAKEAHALPNVYLGDKSPIKPKERRKKLCFARTNSKRFLGSGALILLTSLFTPFTGYYLILGSILLATAAITRIFGYE